MNTVTTPPATDEFTIAIEQVHDYEFRVRFDKPQFPDWILDEPVPLGGDSGPNASRALAAAMGNCLSASLLFCLRKAKIDVGPIRTEVRVRMARNERGRLRIGKVEVRIDPGIPEAEKAKAQRCMTLFEDFCVVTQSVREGIEVEVLVEGLAMDSRAS